MDVNKFIKNLERDYKIKIPSNEHYQYYLDTLKKSKEYDWLSDIEISLEVALTVSDDFSEHRKKIFSKVVSHLKEFGDKVLGASQNSFVEEKIKLLSQYKTLIGQNNNTKYNYYISFDIIEANWSVIRAANNIDLNYESWIKSLGGNHFIAKSKQWRQAAVNQPESKCKANQRVQQAYTVNLYEYICKNTIYSEQIVNMTHDEIIIGFNEFPNGIYNEIFNTFDTKNSIKYKPTIYSLNVFESFDEVIKIKTVFNEDNSIKFKKLIEYNGKHFYFNFKTHILREPISKLDLLYKENGFTYSRVTPNLQLIEDTDKFDNISIAEIYEHLSDEDRMEDLFNLFDINDKYFVGEHFDLSEENCGETELDDFDDEDIVDYIIDRENQLNYRLKIQLCEAFIDYNNLGINENYKVKTLHDLLKVEILQKLFLNCTLKDLEAVERFYKLT